MRYPTQRDVIAVLVAVGVEAQVRDAGLLASALARPCATVFGEDAYPDPWVKAAALMHSLQRNHPFVDGNKRAGWNTAWTFIEVNGIGELDPDFDVDAAEQLVLAVATGRTEDVEQIARVLRGFAVDP
ncbi:type II toxin-antitoxin system death-on-curing family toxin [Luteipulveratus flavus]|uniref:Fic family protein n=1 Tax=Luteipulveratus flavus TaxID=3031728 RepID=A0ABT6C756_9MICO|nr:Fic family protein [Luteipulveratus sp. YIM 133296]MDF8264768.1 Fic family protein [Luteipulveratus sp. YIM 133296]